MNSIKPLNKKELRRIPQAEHLRKTLSAERALIPLAGAWICRLRHVEAKYMVCHHLWEWAEHVNSLRQRLHEMPGGKPDAPLNPSLELLFYEMLFAEDEAPFMEALYTVILPEIKQSYSEYYSSTGELPDRPTVVILQEVIACIDRQIQAGTDFLKLKYAPLFNSSGSSSTKWTQHIGHLLNLTGGIIGKGSEQSLKESCLFNTQKYEFPLIPHREQGMHFSTDFPPVDGLQFTLKDSEVELGRFIIAIWLYNEMDASEYIPSVLYTIKGMPWEFYYDVARHTWDESRHSEFGYHLLQRLGFNPQEFEVCASTYMGSIVLEPHELYTAVTHWYEPGSFTIKPDYMEKLAREIGEEDWALELLRFDLADETTHVTFGHKWVPKLMQHYGETRSLEQFVEDVKEKGMAIRAEQTAAFVRTMPLEQRHSVESICKRLESWVEGNGGRVVARRE